MNCKMFHVPLLAISLILLGLQNCGHGQDQGPSAAKQDVLKAYEAGIGSEKDFRTVFDFVKASEEESKWREIPWDPNLWNGRARSAQLGKPLFIWAMNGDPLGCV